MSTATAVEADLEQIFSNAGATGFVHAKQVGRDDGPQVCLNADSPVVLASVFKILVLTAFAEEVTSGRLDPLERATVTARYRIGGVGTAGFADDTTASLRDLSLNMMSFSDNAATDVIYHRLGHERVGAVATGLGLSDTALIGCCEDVFASVLDDLGASAESDPEEVLAAASEEQVWGLRALDAPQTSHSTPRDITAVLDAIWTDRAASSEACAMVREVMGKQVWQHRLSSGFDQDGITIAAKTGTLPGVRNEAGVVTYPDGASYAVAVFTRADDLGERRPRIDASIGLAARACVEQLRA